MEIPKLAGVHMFHGSIVALVTPMQANGDVDFDCLTKLVDWHITNGTDGIVVVGTTGEAPTLGHEEQLAVISAVVQQANDRIPVIAGTGTNATDKTIHLTREAMELGVDACLIVTPYYNKPMQNGLYQHFRAIAEAVPVPIIMYNVPGRTGCEILPETVQQLADVPNIIGIKEGRFEVAKDIIARCGDRVSVFSGDDDTGLDIINAGGKGIISVAANLFPKKMHELCTAALNKDMVRAKQINDHFTALFKLMFIESNPIPVKWAMYDAGLIPAGIRLPLTLLSEKNQLAVKTALEQASVEI